jgi:hypothetical protein
MTSANVRIALPRGREKHEAVWAVGAGATLSAHGFMTHEAAVGDVWLMLSPQSGVVTGAL